ncbi:hypothetical protein [Shewanella chilikensis]
MSNTSWTPLIVLFGVLCAIAGWCVIETLIWLFDAVSFNFGG